MDFDIVQLGKHEYVHDERTVMMGPLLTDAALAFPATYDFDKNRRPFPKNVWGNDEYGDCVIAGRCNNLLRLERAETRGTPVLTNEIAVEKYFQLTGGQDVGLNVISTLRDWRTNGWDLKGSAAANAPTRNFRISAFGELDPLDIPQQKAAIYALHGVQFGYWLPRQAQVMTRNGVWDYNGETGSSWNPGSWGGHLVYSKQYSPKGMTVRTWGIDVLVTDAFHKKYCDESWVVIDDLDKWRTKPEINIVGLMQKLKDIGASHIEKD